MGAGTELPPSSSIYDIIVAAGNVYTAILGYQNVYFSSVTSASWQTATTNDLDDTFPAFFGSVQCFDHDGVNLFADVSDSVVGNRVYTALLSGADDDWTAVGTAPFSTDPRTLCCYEYSTCKYLYFGGLNGHVSRLDVLGGFGGAWETDFGGSPYTGYVFYLSRIGSNYFAASRNGVYLNSGGDAGTWTLIKTGPTASNIFGMAVRHFRRHLHLFWRRPWKESSVDCGFW